MRTLFRSFYQVLYKGTSLPITQAEIPRLINPWSEELELPDITLDELLAGLKEMKNNKLDGVDQIEIEAVTQRGISLHKAIYTMHVCQMHQPPTMGSRSYYNHPQKGRYNMPAKLSVD